jgi:hypothetical protein
MSTNLRKSMALPPIQHPKVKPDERVRSMRVRVELTAEKARWLMGIVRESMDPMNIESDEFANAFSLLNNLREQLVKIGGNK